MASIRCRPDNRRGPGIFGFQQSIRDQRYKLILNPLSGTDANTNLFAEAYLHQYNQHFAAGCTESEIATASEHIRRAYHRFASPPKVELYDLQSDPHEFTNLAASPQYSEIRQRLMAAFRSWQRETADPFADPLKLERFTRSQLDAIDTNYRNDKSFRWPYLDEFRR